MQQLTIMRVNGRVMHLKAYMKNCGLPHCRFCNRSDGTKRQSHGPYWLGWYVGEESDGKIHYFGRTLPVAE